MTMHYEIRKTLFLRCWAVYQLGHSRGDETWLVTFKSREDADDFIARKTGADRMDLIAFIFDQIHFSREVFGPGRRTVGVVRHIRKELVEIEADPTNLEEWIDVILLALDGAWRCAGPASTPHLICKTLQAKLAKNKTREWPDWRMLPQDAVIEHKK